MSLQSLNTKRRKFEGESSDSGSDSGLEESINEDVMNSYLVNSAFKRIMESGCTDPRFIRKIYKRLDAVPRGIILFYFLHRLIG